MAVVRESDAKEWINHPCTKALLSDLQDYIDGYCAKIIMTAGSNQLDDRYHSGIVRGAQYVTEWKPDIVSDEEGDNV